MKFTQIPANTYKELQLNAGVLLSDFTPSTAELTLADILGATDGGVNVTATPTYIDLAEGIDNSVKNTKEGKELDSWEFKLSGTFKTVTTDLAKKLLGAADIGTPDTTKVTPRTNLTDADLATTPTSTARKRVATSQYTLLTRFRLAVFRYRARKRIKARLRLSLQRTQARLRLKCVRLKSTSKQEHKEK